MTNNCIMCIQYFFLGFTFLIALICLGCQNTAGVSLHVNLSQFKRKFAWKLMLKLLEFGGVQYEAAGPRSCSLTADPGQPGPGRCSNRPGGSCSMGKGCLRWDIHSTLQGCQGRSSCWQGWKQNFGNVKTSDH